MIKREKGHVYVTPSHNTAYWLIVSTRDKPPSKDKWLHTVIQHIHTQPLFLVLALNRSLKCAVLFFVFDDKFSTGAAANTASPYVLNDVLTKSKCTAAAHFNVCFPVNFKSSNQTVESLNSCPYMCVLLVLAFGLGPLLSTKWKKETCNSLQWYSGCSRFESRLWHWLWIFVISKEGS